MERNSLNTEPTEPQPFYRQKLETALQKHIPDVLISPQHITIALNLLDDMRATYGNPNNENYLLYHNDEHAFDVIERSLRIGKIFNECAPDYFTERDFGLAIVAGAGHDNVQRNNTGTDTDEQLSAQYVHKVMITQGCDEQDAERTADAIIATTASHGTKGVQQTHVRSGRTDPLKLVVALADIQAMSMEGTGRMLKDVSRLYFEINPPQSKSKSEHAEGLAKFLLVQSTFLSQRLDSVAGDLRYYFPNDIAAQIEKRNRKEFRTRGIAAIHTTKEITAAASTLVDTITAYVDQIPAKPQQASVVAQKSLRKVLRAIKRNV